MTLIMLLFILFLAGAASFNACIRCQTCGKHAGFLFKRLRAVGRSGTVDAAVDLDISPAVNCADVTVYLGCLYPVAVAAGWKEQQRFRNQ